MFNLLPGMNCRYCQGKCIKKGKYMCIQKYQCIACNKFQRAVYKQQTHGLESENKVKVLTTEGVGIRSIGRILKIAPSSVSILLKRASRRVVKPEIQEKGQIYEIDEMHTYVGNKNQSCYIIYAINRKTRQIINFVTGPRTKVNVSNVVADLLLRSPKRIYTDGLPVYKFLIPSTLHGRSQFKTNRIERKNLTLRTHLKRLGRRTICFSKNEEALSASFRLYAWG